MIGYQEVLDIWEEVNKEDFPETQQGNFDMAGMSRAIIEIVGTDEALMEFLSVDPLAPLTFMLTGIAMGYALKNGDVPPASRQEEPAHAELFPEPDPED